MARPNNWQQLVREHGWGTAVERINRNSRRLDNGCYVWRTPRGVPQIAMRVGGYDWRENVQRLVWMICQDAFVPDGWEVRRACDTVGCIRHVFIAERGDKQLKHVCQRTADATRRSPIIGRTRKLSPQQVSNIRRRAAQGLPINHLAERYGVTGGVIYSVANRFSYLQPGEPVPERGSMGRYRRFPRPGDMCAG